MRLEEQKRRIKGRGKIIDVKRKAEQNGRSLSVGREHKRREDRCVGDRQDGACVWVRTLGKGVGSKNYHRPGSNILPAS